MKLLRSKLGLALIAAVLLQLCVLIGEYLTSVYPIWTGEKVTLAIAPVDPRSLFRGQYAQLNYDIGTIRKDAIENLPDGVRNGEVVYVKLQKKNEMWVASGASLEEPDGGLFIRGRVDGNRWSKELNIRYGIEAFFASPQRARAIEDDLRDNNWRSRKVATADVMIASNGRATLIDVETKKLRNREAGNISVTRTMPVNFLELGKRINENEFSTGLGQGNNAYCHACPQEVKGQRGTALRFDGVDDSLMVVNDWRLRSHQLTFTAWVKLDAIEAQEYTILSMQRPGNRSGYKLSYRTRADGVKGFEAVLVDHQMRQHTVFYPVTVVPNSWHYVAMVYDGKQRKLIIDCKADKQQCFVEEKEQPMKSESCSTSIGIKYDDTPLSIGSAGQGGDGFWRGDIEALSIFQRALSDAELKERMKERMGNGAQEFWE